MPCPETLAGWYSALSGLRKRRCPLSRVAAIMGMQDKAPEISVQHPDRHYSRRQPYTVGIVAGRRLDGCQHGKAELSRSGPPAGDHAKNGVVDAPPDKICTAESDRREKLSGRALGTRSALRRRVLRVKAFAGRSTRGSAFEGLLNILAGHFQDFFEETVKGSGGIGGRAFFFLHPTARALSSPLSETPQLPASMKKRVANCRRDRNKRLPAKQGSSPPGFFPCCARP